MSADALEVVRAWASHNDHAGAMRALSKAEALAEDFHDWYELAETAAKSELGADVVRRALERAEPLVEDEDARMTLATAYVGLLNDIEAADRHGPRGLRPEALRSPQRELAGWSGSASRAFDLLLQISKADYGTDAALHFAVLQDICTTGLLPRGLGWHPGEVLRLTRWSEGERTDHLARALACVILCLPFGDDDDLITNGPILLDSCSTLGEPLLSACIEFFVWRIETTDDDDDTHARLLLLLAQAALDPDDPRLASLTVEIAEQGVAGISNSMREDLWHELIGRLLASRPDLRQAISCARSDD